MTGTTAPPDAVAAVPATRPAGAEVVDVSDEHVGLALAILDATPDGLLLVAQDGAILLANRRLEELFGHPRGTLVGQPVEVLLAGQHHERHRMFRSAYHSAPGIRPMGMGRRLVGRHVDGTDVPVDISLSPLVTTRHGQCVIAVVRDDTERRSAEAAYAEELLNEEEERIARGLLDGAVAGMFRAGLLLDGALDLAGPQVRPRLEQAVQQIDEVIRSMRDVIFRAAAARAGIEVPDDSA